MAVGVRVGVTVGAALGGGSSAATMVVGGTTAALDPVAAIPEAAAVGVPAPEPPSMNAAPLSATTKTNAIPTAITQPRLDLEAGRSGGAMLGVANGVAVTALTRGAAAIMVAAMTACGSAWPGRVAVTSGFGGSHARRSASANAATDS